MNKITKFSPRDMVVVFTLYITWNSLSFSLALAQELNSLSFNFALINTIAELIFIVVVALYLLVTKRILDTKISKREMATIFKYLFLVITLNMVIGTIFEKMGVASESENQKHILNILKQGGLKGTLMLISVVIFAPIIEELVYRGVFQEFLGKFNKKFALIFGTILFAAIHMALSIALKVQGIDLIVQVIPYLLLSFLFSYYYYKTENIFQCIVMHILNNGIAMIIFFVGQLFVT